MCSVHLSWDPFLESPIKARKAVVVYVKDQASDGFVFMGTQKSYTVTVIKLSVNKTKWTAFLFFRFL